MEKSKKKNQMESKRKKEERNLDTKQLSTELKACYSLIIFLKYLSLHLLMLSLWRKTYDELSKILLFRFFICVTKGKIEAIKSKRVRGVQTNEIMYAKRRSFFKCVQVDTRGGGRGGRGGGGIENWTFSGYVLNGGHLCEYVNQQRTKVRTRPC